jgi:hypothetical protein
MDTFEGSTPRGENGAWRNRFSDAGDEVVTFIRHRPLTAILVAVAAGWLLGRMVR